MIRDPILRFDSDIAHVDTAQSVDTYCQNRTVARPSARIQGEINRLVAFRVAFIALVNASKLDQRDFSMFFTKLVPNVPHAEWTKLQTDVATAAGAASRAYLSNGGGTFTLKNAAFIMHNVNPVSNWMMALESPDELKPEMVISSVESAIGVATERFERAKQNERGLVGLIAAFLRWPSTLREAVGDNTYQRSAASAIGVVGQILVGAIAAALGTGLVTGIVALWKLVIP